MTKEAEDKIKMISEIIGVRKPIIGTYMIRGLSSLPRQELVEIYEREVKEQK